MKTSYAALGEETLRRLRESAANANQIQRKLLLSLLEHNKDTVYGKSYHFAEISSPFMYQQTVPVTNYADYDGYIQQMLGGAQQMLTAEPPAYYTISSGSTGGPKYLPVSEEDMQVHYRYAYGAIFGMVREYYSALSPQQIFGKIFQIGEFAKTYTSRGVMNGIRSSSLYQWMDRDGDFDVSDYCVPKEVLFPEDLEDLIYVKVRFALTEPEISAVHGVFIHRVVGVLSYIHTQWDLLLNDMEHGTVDESVPLSKHWREKVQAWLPPNPERARALRSIPVEQLQSCMIAKIWNHAKYILTIGGNGFSSYMEQLRQYAGEIPIHYFAYAASEGIFGVAAGLNCADRYILLPESGFFEFVPMEESMQRPVLMEEVQRGKQYAILFTNHSGLYRYELMDVVEVVDFYGQAPVIRFCYRQNQVISIADERMNTEQFEKTMRLFRRVTQTNIAGYGIQADYSVQPGRYLIYIECTPQAAAGASGIDARQVDRIMEACLQKSVLGYAGCRKMNEISPVHVAVLPQGSFCRYEEHLAAEGRPMGQNKPLRILDSAEKCKFFAEELKKNID